MYKRTQYQLVKTRLEEPRRFIQVITGARQIGKSTLVRQVLDDLQEPWQYYSADNIISSGNTWVSDCWAALRTLMAAKGWGSAVLVLDEVQKIDNWSEAVKKEWDADTFNRVPVKVLLLGSSRVLLKRGLSESLAGRFEEIRMSHWGYAEMRDAFGFSLEQYLFFGGYPGAATLIDDMERYQRYVSSSIVEATISRDILVDTPIGKPALLRQTFELGTAYSGRILSFTKMLGALQDAGNTTTLAGYLNLLGDSGLLCALSKYSVDLARRRASIPKFQVYNNALCTAQTHLTFEQAMVDRKTWGHFVESGIGAYLVSQAFMYGMEVYYWRERNDEVDFVLRYRGQMVAIEVKSNAEKQTAGLQKFRDAFKPRAAFIVGDGGISLADFLSLDLRTLF